VTGDAEWVTESAARLSLPRLRHWERLEERQAAMVLAHPAVPYGVFRPNLVVRIEPADGATMTRLSTAALASTMKVWDDVHVIANDEALKGGLRGRKQKFVYQVRDQTVCVDRWLWLAAGDAVEMTASYSVDQLVGLEPLFNHMVDRARFHGIDEGKA
jgi:hypothetical protein